ncbi:MAG: MFS transporter [Balneolaceae bacterium]|nr:MAG: MFS transporter [Balneolaceae bacterium]
MKQSNTITGTGLTSSKNNFGTITFALVLGFLATLSCGLVSTLMAAYLPNAVADLLGTTTEADLSYVGSYINSLYIFGWAIGGMLFGWTGDRFGRIQSLSISVFIIAVFTIAAAFSPNWPLLVVYRFVTGMGAGAVMVLSAVYVAELWGDRVKGRAFALSIISVGFPIGIVTSGAVTHFIEDWRTAFLVGFLPLALSALCYLILKEPDQWSRLNRRQSNKKAGNRGKRAVSYLLAPENRVNFFVGATIFGSMLVGIWATFSWLPTWAQNLSPGDSAGLQQGGNLVILLGLGGIIGSIFAGFLANGMGRKGALMVAFGGASIAASILYLSNSEFSNIIYIQTAFLAIFFGISQAIMTAYIPELFPTPIRATATGISFNAGRFVTATAVFFVGILVPILGGFSNSLLIFSFTYIIGFVTVMFGKETKGSVL